MRLNICLALYQSLITHSKALKSLQMEYKKHLEREKALGDILESLKNGYNPNYQDMAVLEAVRGWEQLSTATTVEESELGQDEEEPPVEEGMWTAKDLESRKLDQLLKTDYSSLLFEHDQHVATPAPGSTRMRQFNFHVISCYSLFRI
jgi:protein kinase C substrate 80K-H